MHQIGIHLQLLPTADTALRGISRQLLGGPRRSEKAFEQANEFAERRLTTPEQGIGVPMRAPEDIDKALRLPRLQRVRTSIQRHDDIGTEIGQQAPPQAVRNGVHTTQPEQALSFQPFQTEQTVLDKAVADPARLGK